MGSGKVEKKRSKTSTTTTTLGPHKAKTKSRKIKTIKSNNSKVGSKSTKSKSKSKSTKSKSKSNDNNDVKLETAAQQLRFFLDQYQSANGIQLSSLELEAFKDTCMLELSRGLAQNSSTLGEHMKATFGHSWKEVLCEKQLLEGKIDPGNPALIIISLSALRSCELLRGLRLLTGECHAAKLFSKHMKIEDQVSYLKNRVNIACGTPSRIKKLIDMEALGLSRLAVIVLDMHTDVKGYSLFTLPQIRDEFWDLYKSYFHQRLVEGGQRICLYGPIPASSEAKEKSC